MTVEIGGGSVLVGEALESRSVTLAGDTIASVDVPGGESDIDASDLIVSPGFVDVQINGGFGIDLLSEPAGMWQLGRQLPSTGVTAFLPTIITSPAPARRAALDALQRRPDAFVGAEPLGLHFEGPMLSADRRGAHRADLFVEPSATLIDGWSRAAGVALVTLAPELPGADPVIRELVDRGVAVSLGHSTAGSDDARTAVAAGASAVTHLFNAMAPLGHRQPNLVGLALADSDLVAGLIVDGLHVDPVAVSAAWNAKGPTGIALVTDAVAALGQPPGEHRFAGRSLTVDETGVRNRDGTLAGSALAMDQAVRNLVDFTGCPVPDALVAATRTPADMVREKRRGRTEAGAAADLVLLDADLQVQITICAGRVTYVAEGARTRIVADLKEMP